MGMVEVSWRESNVLGDLVPMSTSSMFGERASFAGVSWALMGHRVLDFEFAHRDHLSPMDMGGATDRQVESLSARHIPRAWTKA